MEILGPEVRTSRQGRDHVHWRAVFWALLLWCAQSGAQVPQYAQPGQSSSEEQLPAGKGYLRFPGAPFAEPNRLFLNRGNWQGYFNYGVEQYETYTVSTRSYEIYDRLGHRLLRGYPLASWEENRSEDPTLQRSSIVRAQQHWQWFDNLIVFQESYGGWDVGVMSGDKIRTTLTPLTLSQPRWDGVRLDAQSDRHGITLLLSRGQERRFSAFQPRQEVNPILQYGGRWHSRIGRALTTGLTFFNQHQADLRSSEGHLLKGTLPSGMLPPTTVVVRVQDDSPADASPARVYALHIRLGARRQDGTRVVLSSNPQPAAGDEYEPSLQPVVAQGRRAGDHYEAQGPVEAVDFVFTLPALAAVEWARFEALVEGDYRIGVRQTHQYFNAEARTPAWEERQWPARPLNKLHNIDGRPDYPIDFKPTETQAFYTVVRAQGQGAQSGPRAISFEYGLPTGQTLLGTDFKIEANEVLAQGELVYNWQDNQFPFQSDSLGLAGRHFNRGALAGYLTAIKTFGPRLGRAELGAEVFRLDPNYSGNYDSRRGGMAFFTDNNGDFEVSGTTRKYAGFTQEFELAADNDDGDDWIDDGPAEEGRFQPLQPQVYSGAKAHSGVFPGLDEDGDNTPDTDRNRNGVADWTEPFLLYDSEPPDFVYGADFNNNGLPDFRENDAEPDYPYRRDQQGFHAFAALPKPLPLVRRLSLGYFSARQLASDGRARGPYLRISHRSQVRGVEVRADEDLKYVRDSIRDDVYIFDISAAGINTGSVLTPPPSDPLAMRKSLVNTAFLRLQATPWKRLEVQGQLLHFINKQYDLELEEGARQEGAVRQTLTAIAKAGYTAEVGKCDLWAGMKAVAREGDGRTAAEPKTSVRFFAPIARVVYPFMANISFQWGVSGLSWLPMRYLDNEDESRSYKQNTTTLMINNFTDDYLGYNVSTSVGVQWQRIDYDRGDRVQDSDTFGFFVESFAGF